MLRQAWSAALFRLGMGFVLALANVACTATPPPASSVGAADPAARVPAQRYRSGTPTRAPALAEPQPWQDLNRNVGPPAAPLRGHEP